MMAVRLRGAPWLWGPQARHQVGGLRFGNNKFQRSLLAPSPTFQQSRNYLFLPVSWKEFEERMKRWLLTTTPRTVRVQLAVNHFRNRSRQAQNAMISRARDRYRKSKTILMHRYQAARRRYRVGRSQRRIRSRQRVRSWMNRIRSSSYFQESSTAPFLSPRIRWRDRVRDYVRDKIRKAQAYTVKRVKLQEYSRAEWFDSITGRPLASQDDTGKYVNPWLSQSTNGVHSAWTILTWRLLRIQRGVKEVGIIGSMMPRLSWMEKPAVADPLVSSQPLPLPSENVPIQFTWINHSTCWLQMTAPSSRRALSPRDGTPENSTTWTLLTDPIFSLRASPYQNIPIGVPRKVAPSHTIRQLVDHCRDITPLHTQSQVAEPAKIDVCCISHDHYDHCDKNSIIELADHVEKWVVPLGLKEWMEDKCEISSDSIIELRWWEKVRLKKSSNRVEMVEIFSEQSSLQSANGKGGSAEGSTLVATCCPAQHWAGRTMWDRNVRLWASFAFEVDSPGLERNLSFFFCGDTAYPANGFPLFRQIGDYFGGFDLAAIPIGAYEPEFMMRDAHVNPAEAIKIHKDLRARKSVSVHWGSFPLSEEPMEEPPQKLQEELAADDDKSCIVNFVSIAQGDTLEVCPDTMQVEEQ